MSKLAEFRALEQQLAAQLAELEALKKDGGLKKEMEFEEKLRTLMSKYDKGLRDIIAILDPQTNIGKLSKQDSGVRRPRQVKRYKHPKTGEIVETKGGNHKVLKAWKEEFGADVVESWLQ
ncbi:DNA binding protein [Pseudomonas lalucatii]|uniref:DNA binding protein n=1 Tax=Pseudomonas lalucatii TaxID=1424203 RepID=A0ABS5PYS0_9PSED|nr:histone-like nucleoid-structuring protein, MvaT/MvaU family [Pseudomonas lalucatii]MBS7661642.1 DNA binding protein [Pseudomonas lalucatii]MBS7723943.1 DNA binding protein [Pseudomonas lalucatii]QVM88054.1 DNA binding protein [Pseudomonas lalucatii]